MTNLLMVVDGNNFCLRNSASGAAFRDRGGAVLQTSDGLPTGMLLGSINALISLVSRFEPTALVFTFDQGRSSFRTAIRASYKSNRDGPSYADQFRDQFGYFTEFLRLINVPVLRYPNVEADDLIAAVVGKARPYPTMIVSADHDLLQLVGPTVTVFRNSIGASPEVIYDEAKVIEKYDLPPGRLADMWAIMGDSGDGIAGLEGVGPKRATAMIKRYGTVSEATEDPKCAGMEQHLIDNLKLIRLREGKFADLVPNDLDLLFAPGYSQDLRDYLERFEFRSLTARFDSRTLWKTARMMELGKRV